MQAAGLITFVKKAEQQPRTLGERVRWARDQRGMSQAELAVKAGVQQGTIGNIEAGIRKKPRELLSIAKALGAHAEWLEAGRGAWETAKGAVFKEPTPEEWELLAHWRHLLSKDKKAKLSEIVALAEEREAEKKEMLAEAGLDRIMERAANAARPRGARTTAKAGDPAHKQRSLLDE